MKKLLSYANIDKNVDLYVKQPNGRYRAANIAEVFAGARYITNELIKLGESCDNPDKVRQFCIGKLSGVGHEVFGCLFLDAQHRLIEYVEPFNGTLTQTAVYPREIAKLALELNACSIIVTHNHPSGSLSPSEADKSMTMHLQQALALIDIKMLDHVLVAGGKAMSFAQEHLL